MCAPELTGGDVPERGDRSAVAIAEARSALVDEHTLHDREEGSEERLLLETVLLDRLEDGLRRRIQVEELDDVRATAVGGDLVPTPPCLRGAP